MNWHGYAVFDLTPRSPLQGRGEVQFDGVLVIGLSKKMLENELAGICGV